MNDSHSSAAGADVDLAALPTRALPEGAQLWHGSDCAGKFSVPDGPAWFALDEQSGLRWARWRQRPPAGRSRGPARLFRYVVARPVDLVDTAARGDWAALAALLCGDPEAGSWQVASALAATGAGGKGWYGRAEVLLCDPAQCLDLVEARVLGEL